jgi:hypothetical protein
MMDNPPYNANLMTGEFLLPESFKKTLTGKLFATDMDVKQAVTSWLQTNETDFYYVGIYALVSR